MTIAYLSVRNISVMKKQERKVISVNTSKGDIKVGDKFVIEVGEIIPDKNGKPLYKIKGFNTLVFDDVGISRLMKKSNLTGPEAIRKAWKNGYDAGRLNMLDCVDEAFDEIRRMR